MLKFERIVYRMFNNMTLRKIYLGLIGLFVGWSCTFGQSNTAIGEWRSYLPYNQGIFITQSAEKIIYSSEFSILTIDKTDFSLDFLTKVEGLSDISISALSHNPSLNQLLIAYENSNIDLVTEDDIINIPNILTNTSILGDKSINDIYMASNNMAYLSCGFGIVEYDLEDLEFGFTSFTDLVVFETTILGDFIYAATEDGLYYFDLSTNFNPADFALWELMGDNNGLPELFEARAVASKNGQLYMATNESLYVSNDGFNFEKILDAPSGFFSSVITEFVDHIGWGVNNQPNGGFDSRFFTIDPSGNFENIEYCGDRITGALLDQNNRYWYADSNDGIKFTEGLTGTCQYINIDGPNSHEVSDIDVVDDVVYAASGGVNENFTYQFTANGFYELQEGNWSNQNFRTLPDLAEREYFHIFQVEKDPNRNILWVGSYFSGLMAYNLDDGSTTFYDSTNSTLGEAVGDPGRIRISGLAFDDDGNLWISNFLAVEPLSVMTPEGEWKSIPVSASTQLVQIAIDERGEKWITIAGNSGGVLVYGSGEDPLSTEDDEGMRFLNLANSELNSNIISAVNVDLDGDVWVGTESGPIVFECGSGLDDACRGTQRIFVQDSIADILLRTEDIRSIEIDGANRKWFGTKNGLYVLSPDTQVQIEHFTAENSPLFDNTVRDLAYSEVTGEMFIATDRGILSYRSPTSEGGIVHDPDLLVFPNPVRPDYRGPIAIRGLAQDAEVKITDINGRLIFETTALGGQAIWDGNDFNGRRASTGVYLVFSSSSNSLRDPDAAVTKIMLVN